MKADLERPLIELAQGLRKSHCSRADDALHECVGTTTITKDGVTLACKLCGSDDRPIAPAELLRETRIARAVVEAAGIDWDCLSARTRRAAVDVLERSLKR